MCDGPVALQAVAIHGSGGDCASSCEGSPLIGCSWMVDIMRAALISSRGTEMYLNAGIGWMQLAYDIPQQKL